MAGSRVDIKVVLLGKAYAGKTSLVERYIHDRFSGDVVPYQNVMTIGAAFGAKKMDVDGQALVMGIWDTAGSERYEAMSRIYYRGARAAILCFDLTDKSSFDRARFWIGELKAHEESCKIYLCGTKKDLVTNDPELRRVNERAAKALADDCMSDIYETSSKSGENIKELFVQIAKDYLASVRPETPEKGKDTFVLRELRKSTCMCKGS
ncbi:ras-related protein Rab-24-like isoform X1 [Haliotis rufescens]|uniref:ras-related protein Rab-24-like isoform X1 n=1 Tax=Haliotis rufescens TaxID=6454 RepID=UPI001EB0A38C|nr:ras-related protein Rab-24-like isoform X1 [Haliotis rufescens]XP_046361134.1 ras-related protein Rab-24-like isoform X1 [Haliotis rufescens]XP_046361135.1 ras-related protein Rab-24-like isoform X1 [Haliotis rufescens]